MAEKYSLFQNNNLKNHSKNIIQNDIARASKKLTKKSSNTIFSMTILTKDYNQEKQTYEWRLKTQFPIVKIVSYDLQKYDPHKSMGFLKKKVSVQLEIEKFPATLNELTSIPLFKILYLLKQSLIGLQRLVNRFGYFQVKPEMIVINKQSKCNIWLNENLASNQIQTSCSTQKELLKSLFKAVQARSAVSKKIINFFEFIKTNSTIIESMSAIQIFAKIGKIKIPTQFLIKPQSQNMKCLSPQNFRFNSSHPSPAKKPTLFFSPNTSLKKVPKFIENFRSTLESPIIKKKFNSTELKRNWLADIKNNVQSPKVQIVAPHSQKRIPTFITLKNSGKDNERITKSNSNENEYRFSQNQEDRIAKLIGIEQCDAESYRESMVMLDISMQSSIAMRILNEKIPVFQRNESFMKELDTSSFIINDQKSSKLLIFEENCKKLESTMGDTGKIGLKWQQKLTSLFDSQKQMNKSVRQEDDQYNDMSF